MLDLCNAFKYRNKTDTLHLIRFNLRETVYLEGLDGGGGEYKFQLSVKILAICQLSVKF